MKVLVLSTETKHHTYFINKLCEKFDIVGILYERRRLAKNYPTGPFFKEEEDRYEEKFFDLSAGGVSRELPGDLAKRVVSVHSVNQPGVPEYIKALKPDVGITFGVGQVNPPTFSAPRWGTINIHRGISQLYRGLDSDLWAIYLKKFGEIGVTVHYVEEALDTGDILAQEKMTIGPGDEIYHIRYKTTVMATRMVADVLSRFAGAGKRITGRLQLQKGEYYTAMPLDKKLQALEKFNEFKKSLM